ncbi:DUF1844 domain-containing protein [Gordonia sp. (in: high G+C Gram-positive bacteria)]|uniref:DUF1844 domain-containing protein n=1 Tax=Gordonia sp. (in: high G+C Gram-positive bacteria) TaxID=84139 RepID=UPI003C72BC04
MSPNSYSPDQSDSDDNVHVANQPVDDDNVRDLIDIPAVEVITRSAVMLMSSAAEKLALAEGADPDSVDLPEARALISALAGLVVAALGDLGMHRKPLQDGLRALQLAFREASAYPDEPGEGPGEQFTGPVKG